MHSIARNSKFLHIHVAGLSDFGLFTHPISRLRLSVNIPSEVEFELVGCLTSRAGNLGLWRTRLAAPMTKADEDYSYAHFGCGGNMMATSTDGPATSVRIERSVILGAHPLKKRKPSEYPWVRCDCERCKTGKNNS
jgi:hypothetical protein